MIRNHPDHISCPAYKLCEIAILPWVQSICTSIRLPERYPLLKSSIKRFKLGIAETVGSATFLKVSFSMPSLSGTWFNESLLYFIRDGFELMSIQTKHLFDPLSMTAVRYSLDFYHRAKSLVSGIHFRNSLNVSLYMLILSKVTSGGKALHF
jgi:hypothetical protein